MSKPRHTSDFLATTAALYGDTIQHNPSSTIVPSGVEAPTGKALAVLEQLLAEGRLSAQQQFQLEHTLGQGGMGIVRLATQASLGRQVAIKTIRPEMRRIPEAIEKLLHEGWLTGSLEHPNIVPVYDLTVAKDKEPAIVFKLISGTTWSELIRNPVLVKERFEASDLLEWNLGILLQVINAVRFAHSRGIVHRDLKPQNVMIGEFGEVYLVDWGIAVSLIDKGTWRLPLAKDAIYMAGTPCYMAPEMLGSETPAITERTDVYLLGAILYEILVGEPPHRGETPLDILKSVAKSSPEIPASAPAGLAQICLRAMARDPEDRLASADEMRRQIQIYLKHRGSEELARSAQGRFRELVARLDAGKAGGMEHRQDIYRLYGACRFGFREALEIWSGNLVALEGLKKATELMIEYELSHSDPRAATALLADITDITDISAEVRQRLTAAMQAKAEEEKRLASLEKLHKDFDLQVGSRSRVRVTIVCIGGLWTIGPFVRNLISPVTDTIPGNLRMAAWSLFSVLIFLATVAVFRSSLLTSRINRRLVIAVASMMAGQVMLYLGAELAGFPAVVAQTCQMFLWAVVTGMLTIFVDRYLFPSVLGYLVGFFFIALAPSFRFYAMAAANLLVALNVVFVWGSARSESAQPLPSQPTLPGSAG